MKYLALVLLLAGCSGLSVQWVMSYSTTDLATAIKMPVAVPFIDPAIAAAVGAQPK